MSLLTRMYEDKFSGIERELNLILSKFTNTMKHKYDNLTMEPAYKMDFWDIKNNNISIYLTFISGYQLSNLDLKIADDVKRCIEFIASKYGIKKNDIKEKHWSFKYGSEYIINYEYILHFNIN
jgi:hypothetical protein